MTPERFAGPGAQDRTREFLNQLDSELAEGQESHAAGSTAEPRRSSTSQENIDGRQKQDSISNSPKKLIPLSDDPLKAEALTLNPIGSEESPTFLDPPAEEERKPRRKRAYRFREKRGDSVAVKIPELLYRQLQLIAAELDSPLLWVISRAISQWVQAYKLTRHDDIAMLARQYEDVRRQLLLVSRIHLDVDPAARMSEPGLMETLRDTGNKNQK